MKNKSRKVNDCIVTTVVHITSVHQPDDVRIFVKECCTLANASYRVYLVAPAQRDCTVDGVRIVTIRHAQNKFERFIKTGYAIYKKSIQIDGDIYQFHDPELIIIGMLLKLRGKKVVYDVHEDVPLQIMSKSWIHPTLRKPLARIVTVIEKIGSKMFDKIVVATPSIAKKFPEQKCVLVQNYPIIGELFVDSQPSYMSRELRVVYAGGITRVRGILELVEALKVANDEINTKLFLAGRIQDSTFSKTEMKLITQNNYIEWLGWKNRKDIRKLYSQSRAGLVTLHPAPNYIDSQPIKLFEYMSAGLPVIASDFPLWREIIDDCQCGILVDPLNPNEIASAICWILSHPDEAEQMGRRGKKAVKEKYSWESQVPHLLAMYEEMRP